MSSALLAARPTLAKKSLYLKESAAVRRQRLGDLWVYHTQAEAAFAAALALVYRAWQLVAVHPLTSHCSLSFSILA